MFDPSRLWRTLSVFAKIAVFNSKLSAVETEEGSISFVGTPLEETLPSCAARCEEWVWRRIKSVECIIQAISNNWCGHQVLYCIALYCTIQGLAARKHIGTAPILAGVRW